MRSLVIALLSVSLGACGSAPDSSLFADNGGGGGGVDSGGGGGDTAVTDSGTAPGDSGSPPVDTGKPPKDTGTPPDTTPPPPDVPTGVTLDDVCTKLADAICTGATQTCCLSKGIDYNEAGCRSGVATFCGVLVAEAKASKRTFDPSKFDGCAAAWKSLSGSCSVNTIDYLKVYAPCDALLPGLVSPGGSCSADTDCSVSPGADAICRSTTTGTCENITIVGKGAPCNYDGSVRGFCDNGLYCPYTGGPATCKTAKPLGGSCSGADDVSCGFGNQCQLGHCAPGLPKGSSCSGPLECASWNCAGGRCTDPDVTIASSATCNGG